MTAIVPNLAASDYHNDLVADVPTLSASIAKVLLAQSPLHAWTQHPRLNPHFVRQEDDKFSVGIVAHSVLLEGIDAVEVIEADDWRSNAAKEARTMARAAGKIPLLGKHYFDVLQMVDAARRQLEEHQAFPPLFVDGKPEQTITWTDHGVLCRARLDWPHDDFTAADDLKSTARSAKSEDFERTIYPMGYDIQVAAHLRALKSVSGIDAVWRWVVVETTPPYALSVNTPSPATLALGNDRWDQALSIWKRCLETGEWSGYDKRVATVDVPGWAEAQWAERQAA